MRLQKGAEPLGISIVSGEKGGVYVSKVTGGSIAHQAGLEYGDQLLEVRGPFCLSSVIYPAPPTSLPVCGTMATPWPGVPHDPGTPITPVPHYGPVPLWPGTCRTSKPGLVSL